MTEKPSKVWSRWGIELRKHRSRAGKTQAELADLVTISRPQLGKLESGTRTPSSAISGALDEALATGGVLQHLWSELKAQEEIPPDWRDFVMLERQATQVREYQPLMVPGLLQTEDYARTLLRQSVSVDDEEEVERLVQARMERYEALPRTLLTFVVDQPVLERVVGTADIMREQLTRLLELSNQRVRITVIPRDAPHRPLVGGSFRIMTLPTGGMVAHSEHPLGQVVVNQAKDVGKLFRYFDNLQSEALSPTASRELIDRMRGVLG
ncbi:helix-turn-helix transcriptional regulator [Streptomonospora sp. S1-112]|uniref:Helix-turn-helix transcriptional regulator n=1 Tax=Streptomonospora mangrovi TaxID=2883123 RepID=A0A9X3NHZ6_9ACTN|nr:helix-turn-helix transcriptional regulator [Streptomonospora mangrovi]MDA0563762.1 helix-turn-helix transcriptional regulator [Streptomonospora mangrovi]